jgi:hypothetical protein
MFQAARKFTLNAIRRWRFILPLEDVGRSRRRGGRGFSAPPSPLPKGRKESENEGMKTPIPSFRRSNYGGGCRRRRLPCRCEWSEVEDPVAKPGGDIGVFSPMRSEAPPADGGDCFRRSASRLRPPDGRRPAALLRGLRRSATTEAGRGIASSAPFSATTDRGSGAMHYWPVYDRATARSLSHRKRSMRRVFSRQHILSINPTPSVGRGGVGWGA